MYQFEEVSRPVLFEDPTSEFTYWGNGSSFLISSANAVYWVTAAHVMKNMGARAHSVRICPSDVSRVSLPFNERYTVTKGAQDDEDYNDIFMMRIDLSHFDRSGDAPLVSQRLEDGVLPASRLKCGDELWVIGYPGDSNVIDYDTRSIKNTRSVIRAIYNGTFVSEHCHSIRIETSLALKTYDGLSGSPVYLLQQRSIGGETVAFPMMVGMVLRGTASSRKLHFVCVSVLADLVRAVETDA